MPTEIFTILAGAGVAGVWLICILLGYQPTRGQLDDLKEQNKELKEALNLANQRADDERRRGDSAEEAARTSNLLLAALHKGIANDSNKT